MKGLGTGSTKHDSQGLGAHARCMDGTEPAHERWVALDPLLHQADDVQGSCTLAKTTPKPKPKNPNTPTVDPELQYPEPSIESPSPSLRVARQDDWTLAADFRQKLLKGSQDVLACSALLFLLRGSCLRCQGLASRLILSRQCCNGMLLRPCDASRELWGVAGCPAGSW